MWVIANGAPKTGSTWPVQLLTGTRRFDRVPDELQDPTWKNSSVRDDITEAYIDMLAASSTRYLSKQHWFNKHKDLLGVPGIKILNSVRDIRDTFVSRYYHDVRLAGVKDPIQKYLRKKGKFFVSRFCEYQQYWIDAAEKQPQSYYILSYERMSRDYENGARDLLAFCDVDLTDEEFTKVTEYGSFETRNSGPGKFFRKGKVHAFSDDLSEENVEYLMKLAESHGLRDIKRRIIAFNPSLKPFLEMTDTGL